MICNAKLTTLLIKSVVLSKNTPESLDSLFKVIARRQTVLCERSFKLGSNILLIKSKELFLRIYFFSGTNIGW